MLRTAIDKGRWTSNVAIAASNTAFTGIADGQTSNVNNLYVRENGSVSAPSVTWSNSSNSGLYLAGANQLAFTAGGYTALQLSNCLTVVNSNLACIGTLGVGLSNPSARLHVLGNAWASNVLALASGTNTSPAFSWTGSSNTGMFLPSTNKLGFTAGGSNVLFMTSNAVGINTATPAYALHVVGSIYASGTVTSSSDSTLKSNITLIPDCLAKLDLIHGYTFQYNDDPTEKRYTGVLAQEMQAVLPEVVDAQGGTLSVAYGNIAGLLINAIKELKELHVSDRQALQAQIDELKAR
ncbi:Protein rcdK [Tetrabaena socialis]|uniref:Protein rcdK n=1 Tax=Tetrabaena socialis TaxID=47790 RepID=A0A2J7ZJG7_9CHLO|nr:Protein rcdK [Tetrabaena socialis]|eukprot:PNH00412.1 Protein rcdK [Tetrabaena socialis]